MKKAFGELNLSWKKIIISAIIIGILVGLVNSISFFKNTSFTDPAIYFDLWILFGILIITNSKSNKESALKCFVFFLISQPIIYLVEVPFSHLGWQLFRYYKYWFIWTILCLPMGYIGYYIKKDKWWGLLILFPIMMLLGSGVNTHLSNMIFSFPRHLISLLFCITTLIIYPIVMLNNKKLKTIGLILAILLILGFSIITLTDKPVYETEILCNGGKYTFDITYTPSLKDSKYGEVIIKKIDDDGFYCVHAKLKKAGKTELILTSSDGKIQRYSLNIERTTYDIDKIEEK